MFIDLFFDVTRGGSSEHAAVEQDPEFHGHHSGGQDCLLLATRMITYKCGKQINENWDYPASVHPPSGKKNKETKEQINKQRNKQKNKSKTD